MSNPLPTRLRVMLALQLVLALLFLLMAWDHTVSLAQGRPARFADVALMALPLLAVLGLGAASVEASRAGAGRPATLCALLPFPLTFVIYAVLGAI